MEKLKREISEEFFNEAKKYIPGGVTGIRHPFNFVEGEYPIFIRSGKGGRITDVDGNEYIDFLCSYGPVILGNREEEVDDAVVSQIKGRGFCFTLCQEFQNKLAKKLKDLIPCAEMSFFGISGSDATTSAIRIARAHIHRQKIIRCGYHGWHDWSVELKEGIPSDAYKDVAAFNFNDINSLKEAIKGEEPAAIIITPVHTPVGDSEVLEPQKGFLEEAKELAHNHGAVLIFDEIRTGFRMGLGGAQKHYGVTPDIGVFGKAMANGYPISAICGRKDIMESLSHVFISSTFFSNSLGMVAALKTIEILEREKVLDKVWHLGKRMFAGMQQVIDETNFPVVQSGPPPMPNISFKKEGNYKEKRKLFYTALIRQGIFMAPYHHSYIAYRHTEQDIDYAVASVRKAIDFVNEKLS